MKLMKATAGRFEFIPYPENDLGQKFDVLEIRNTGSLEKFTIPIPVFDEYVRRCVIATRVARLEEATLGDLINGET